MSTIAKKISSLDNVFININDDTIIKRLATQRIKENSKVALSQVLEIITNKESYNNELDETLKGTPYENVNHCFNLVNNVLLAHNDLEKSVEKIITSISRVLLVSKKVNFSAFIKDLKDFSTYESNAGLYTEFDLLDNENFKAKNAVINDFFNRVKAYPDANKALRKAIGAKKVTITGNSGKISLAVVIKDYKLSKSALPIEDFTILSDALNEAYKDYYKSLNA